MGGYDAGAKLPGRESVSEGRASHHIIFIEGYKITFGRKRATNLCLGRTSLVIQTNKSKDAIS